MRRRDDSQRPCAEHTFSKGAATSRWTSNLSRLVVQSATLRGESWLSKMVETPSSRFRSRTWVTPFTTRKQTLVANSPETDARRDFRMIASGCRLRRGAGWGTEGQQFL